MISLLYFTNLYIFREAENFVSNKFVKAFIAIVIVTFLVVIGGYADPIVLTEERFSFASLARVMNLVVVFSLIRKSIIGAKLRTSSTLLFYASIFLMESIFIKLSLLLLFFVIYKPKCSLYIYLISGLLFVNAMALRFGAGQFILVLNFTLFTFGIIKLILDQGKLFERKEDFIYTFLMMISVYSSNIFQLKMANINVGIGVFALIYILFARKDVYKSLATLLLISWLYMLQIEIPFIATMPIVLLTVQSFMPDESGLKIKLNPRIIQALFYGAFFIYVLALGINFITLPYDKLFWFVLGSLLLKAFLKRELLDEYSVLSYTLGFALNLVCLGVILAW